MEKEPKKKYASKIEQRRRPLKNVDAAARAWFLRAALWLVPTGLMFTILIGAVLADRGMPEGKAYLTALAYSFGGLFLVYGFLYFGVIGGTASFLGKIYFSSAAPIKQPKSWRGQALAVHGSHKEALKAFEEEAARYPHDPGPCLRAAAVCLEEMDDPESAIAWYLRARQATGLTRETDQYICVRLADLYETLGSEGSASVELRRLLQKHPGSQYAPGARARLAELKMRRTEQHEADDPLDNL
jgi:tetratricopeptide (TPR) repeat protein